MSTTAPAITPETASHVLWMYGYRGGRQPGHFTQHLASAIESADRKNEAILTAAYPELSAAIRLAKHDETGIDKLKELAAPRCTRCRGTDGPFTDAGLCEGCNRPVPLGGVA